MIHMKDQVFFSSKDKSKKLKCRLLLFLIGALRINKLRSPSSFIFSIPNYYTLNITNIFLSLLFISQFFYNKNSARVIVMSLLFFLFGSLHRHSSCRRLRINSRAQAAHYQATSAHVSNSFGLFWLFAARTFKEPN